MEQELGLAYSPLCDRNSTLIPQSQIGTYALLCCTQPHYTLVPVMIIIAAVTIIITTIITNTFLSLSLPFPFITALSLCLCLFYLHISLHNLPGFIDFIVAPTMELCGDLIERVHEHINVSAAAAASEAAADDQVAELAAETKSQARSQSSADSTATAKANGSSGPPSSSNTSRYAYAPAAPARLRLPWGETCSSSSTLYAKLNSDSCQFGGLLLLPFSLILQKHFQCSCLHSMFSTCDTVQKASSTMA